MAHRLPTLPLLSLTLTLVIAVTAPTRAQDTLLLQETDVSGKAKLPPSMAAALAANLTLLEERLGRRVREAERRVVHRLEHKFRVLNQTVAITHLEDVVDHYTQELELARRANRDQAATIRRLKAQSTHQQREIHHVRTSLNRMQKTVESLNALVERIVADREREEEERAAAAAGAASATGGTTSSGNHVVRGRPNQNADDNEVDGNESTSVPFKPLFPTDCQYVYESGGMKYPGYYYIMIQPAVSRDPFKVCCKMTNNSGWTLIQRRQDGTVDFYRDWQAYKTGFGNLEGEFWLGNEYIYQLTNQGNYKLRIELRDWDDNDYWAEFDHFRIESEAEKYRLHVHGYHGNAGDSLTSRWHSHNGLPFSTHDADHDERFYDNCAEHYHGAWWFKSCFESHLNGNYYQKGAHNNYFVRNGIQWNTIHLHSSLQSVSMMVKPNPDHREEDEEAANGI